MILLGLTGGFHFGSCDAAAAVMKDGKLVAALEEERVSRVKYSYGIPPTRCIKAVLDVAGLNIHEVDAVVLYVSSYPDAIREMREHIEGLFGFCPPIEVVEHHLAHAASAYYASPWDESAVICLDWSGDGVSSSIWKGEGRNLTKVEDIARPNSLGTFYAAFTQFLGFERGDEYKVMGLASYGEAAYNLDDFLDVSGDIYELNEDLLNKKNRSLYQRVFSDVLGKWQPELRRYPYQKVERKHMDLAASVQRYFEKAFFKLADRARELTGSDKLCLAGGGALNCKANGLLLKRNTFDEIYVPPFPNDTGCAFGTASAHAARNGINIEPVTHSKLGPGFSDEEIEKDIMLLKATAREIDDPAKEAAKRVTAGELVGWFQGRMEVGPRALGARCILADPTDVTARDRINTFVKFRESFRPFAPSVLMDECDTWFDLHQPSPFMSFTADVLQPERLPAITHVDGTARIQTVTNDDHIYAQLLRAMREQNGVGCVLNTSFNYMGQPVVCNPREAIYTFFGTGLDSLIIGNKVIEKNT